MAAQYALSMVEAGRSATVVPLIAGSSAGFDPAAVGRAMSWVAAQALANPSVQWIVAAPIEGGIRLDRGDPGTGPARGRRCADQSGRGE